MKLLKNTLAVAAAVAMLGGPVAASAQTAGQKLSVTKQVRAGAPSKGKTFSNADGSADGSGGGSAGGSTIVAVLAAAAVIAGIAIAGGGSNKPKSP